MGCKVEFRMTPQGEKFFKSFKDLGEKAVYVGFNEKSGSYKKGATIAQIAAFQQFGTSRIPPRPFLSDAFENNADEVKRMFLGAAVKIFAGENEDPLLNEMGVRGVAMVQEEITNGDFVANAPATIRKKGSDKPLIDTGLMRQRVVYEVK